MTIKYKCPDCETIMDLDESDEKHTCPSCEYEVSLEEAEKLFEEGEIIASVEDEDILDEYEIEEEDESYKGFGNKETWATSLVLQNEYKTIKEIIKKSKEDSLTESNLEELVESKPKLFEDIDLDNVQWDEIVEDITAEIAEIESISSDLAEALAGAEELSEETKEKMLTIFESAVTIKVNEIKLAMEDEAEEKLEETKNDMQQDMVNEVDEYLDEVVTEWMSENELAIEQGIRTEITESFLDGLQHLFKEHYIDVPEDRYDVLEDLANKVDELEVKIDEEKEAKRTVKKEITEMKKSSIVSTIGDMLADTDKERLSDLADSIVYESDEQFETDVTTLKESFIDSKNNKNPETLEESEVLTDSDVIDENDNLNVPHEDKDLMKRTLEILARQK